MLDRVTFMAGYAGAYRRARKAGAAHDAALEAAATEMLDRRLGARGPGVAIPDSVAALWRDPEPACSLADGQWFGDGTFTVTSAHLELLRQARFGWDDAERGAPTLDPERPYGRTDLMAQLGEVFATDAADELARRHVEMYFVIDRVLVHGALSAGSYAVGGTADGAVTITDDHLRLARSLQVRWPSAADCEDRLAAGHYPATTVDPKLPYGDFTFIEVDMARILGVLPPPPRDGGPAIFEPGPDLSDRLARLHAEMLDTIQVLVERAELPPGDYGLVAQP